VLTAGLNLLLCVRVCCRDDYEDDGDEGEGGMFGDDGDDDDGSGLDKLRRGKGQKRGRGDRGQGGGAQEKLLPTEDQFMRLSEMDSFLQVCCVRVW